jgi:hypothetical protein
VPIEGVDAKNIPDREIVLGALDHPDGVARSQVTLDEDAQVRTRS